MMKNYFPVFFHINTNIFSVSKLLLQTPKRNTQNILEHFVSFYLSFSYIPTPFVLCNLGLILKSMKTSSKENDDYYILIFIY